MNFKNKLLNYFKLDENAYNELIKPIKDLHLISPYDFYELDEACNFLKEAMNNKKKIMIYGDYDADGIMSTSIMVNTFKALNYQVGYYIPSRFIDGYGINLEKAKLIKEKGYDVLITVDNGVKQNEALNYLMENNIDVILTDHHEYNEQELPLHKYFIHPFHKKEKEYLCGSFVAFMLSIALLGKIDYYLLSLAGLATLSDMMPLDNLNNRNIVRISLAYINKHKEHPFYYLLNKGSYNEESLSFYIAPKINAFGRVCNDTSINKIVNMFINVDEDKSKLASLINEKNELRKKLVLDAYNEAKIDVGEGVISINDNTLDGLIGLVCAKLISTYNKPSISFKKIDNHLKGSARSLKGTSLIKFFDLNKDLFIRYGGHDLAGGLEIEENKLNDLRIAFNDFIKNNPPVLEEDNYIDLSFDEVNMNNYLLLRSFSPFGQDYKEPLFKISVDSKQINFIKGNHIKVFISNEASLIGFNLKDKIKDGFNTFLVHMKEDNYYKNHIQLVVEKII